MIGYYDVVLGLVATLLIGGAIASAIFGTLAIVGAAAMAAAVVGHAMFIRPPRGLEKESGSQVASYEAAD